MKVLWQKSEVRRRKTEARVCLLFSVLCPLFLAGCVSSEQFYEEAGLSRDAAYRQWKSRKERQEQSQTYISGKLNIEDCLKLALGNNKVLQRVVQEKEIARGERLKSYSAILPAVGLTGNYTRKDKVASIKSICVCLSRAFCAIISPSRAKPSNMGNVAASPACQALPHSIFVLLCGSGFDQVLS